MRDEVQLEWEHDKEVKEQEEGEKEKERRESEFLENSIIEVEKVKMPAAVLVVAAATREEAQFLVASHSLDELL